MAPIHISINEHIYVINNRDLFLQLIYNKQNKAVESLIEYWYIGRTSFDDAGQIYSETPTIACRFSALSGDPGTSDRYLAEQGKVRSSLECNNAFSKGQRVCQDQLHG